MEPVPEKYKLAVSKGPVDPIVQKSKYPTLVENLGYLNSVYCPMCGKHLFSYYDKDFLPGRPDGYRFKIWHKWSFCSECGLHLNLDKWKDPNDTAEDINNLFFVSKSINSEDDINLE